MYGFLLLWTGAAWAVPLTISVPQPTMAVNTSQTLTASGGCDGTKTWSVTGGGSITQAGVYTAPSSNPNCASNPVVRVTDECGQIAEVQIAVNGSTSTAEAYRTFSDFTVSKYSDCQFGCPQYCTGCSVYTASICTTGYKCDGTESAAKCCISGTKDADICNDRGCHPGDYSYCVHDSTAYNDLYTAGGDGINLMLCRRDGNTCAYYFLPGSARYNIEHSPYDKRTAAMKTAGCCPAALTSPCSLSISSFSASSTKIDPSTGGTITFNGTIAGSNPAGITWNIAVDDVPILSGTGTSADGTWKSIASTRPLNPGNTYAAVLTATVGSCTAIATTTFTITESSDGDKCGPKMLKLVFGSTANVASGNLQHTQTLFRVPNSRLMPDLALTYNSTDRANGLLATGWTHSYNISLQNNDYYTVVWGDGGKTVLYPDGGVYRPEYSPYPVLSVNQDDVGTLAFRDGTVYTFNADKLASIADRNGNTLSLTYDGNGYLETVTDPRGKSIGFAYNAGNRIDTITDPNNNTHTFTYTGDALTQIASQTPMGTKTWGFTYDAQLFMLTKTDPDGNETRYTYDADHKVTQALDPESKTRTVAYDPATATTLVTERDNGVWTYKYDQALGVLIEKTDPQGHKTTYEYDANRNITKKTDPGGGYTTYTYYANGNLHTATDPLNKTTAYTYNALNLVETVTDPRSNVTQYGYDTAGNLTSVAAPGNAVTYYGYDARGNIASITNPLNKTTTLEYDQYDNLRFVTDPKLGVVEMTYDGLGNMLSQKDALGNTTYFQYNSLNQLTQATDPGNRVTAYTYDYKGNRLSSTDANTKAAHYLYNYRDQLTRITDALGNITNLAYSGSGCSGCGTGVDKLTAVTDAKSHITAYEYNTGGELTRETDPLSKTTTYTYDANGNLHTLTRPDSKTVTYTYDGNNRLTGKTYSDSSTATFQYDDAGNMTYAGNAAIAYTFTYDANNRVTQIVDGNSRTIRYTYDAAGNRQTMVTPENRTLTYTYDNNGLPARIATALGNFDFAYDAANRRMSRTLPNGTVSAYGYDASSRLTGIATTKNSAPVDSVTYTHDNAGNRLTRTAPAESYAYAYDDVYRLTQAAPTGGVHQTEAYTYDEVGNRLTKNADAVPPGNETTTYTYDDENRLTGIQMNRNGQVRQLTFAYDPFGRRVSKTVVSDGIGNLCTSPNTCPRTTYYIFDDKSIILEYNSSNEITARYTHGPNIDEPLAVEVKSGASYTPYYYHADGLGSITGLSDATGTMVQTYGYDAFGNVVATGGVSQPFMFTGREYDSETGMYFYRARYYDPQAGRFVTKDPIGFRGGNINLFGYVQNNPANFIDPEGLLQQCSSGLDALWGAQVGPAAHEYHCWTGSDGKQVCRGYGRDPNSRIDNAIIGIVKGKILKDGENVSHGKSVCGADDNNKCMDKCAERLWQRLEQEVLFYSVKYGADCKRVQQGIYDSCRKECFQ